MSQPESQIKARTVARVQLDGFSALFTFHPCLGERGDVLVVL